MTETRLIRLSARGVIVLSGPDADGFLQGLISADIRRVTDTRSGYGALLTPQGKFLHEMFLLRDRDGGLLLETEAARLPDLLKRLKMYRLRARVDLTDTGTGWIVAVLIGSGVPDRLALTAAPGATRAFGGGFAYMDPRLADLGARLLLPAGQAEDAIGRLDIVEGEEDDWHRLRCRLGVADGARELEVERAILLENGFEELGGVAFDKGCFMGQELTARTKYRGLVKKRLLTIRIDGAAPRPGDVLTRAGERRGLGVVRSAFGDVGLATIRLDALIEGPDFMSGETRITAEPAAWVKFPDTVAEAISGSVELADTDARRYCDRTPD